MAKLSAAPTPDSVKAHILEAEVRQLKKTIKSLNKDMAGIAGSLTRHVAAKTRIKLKPAVRKNRGKEDHVRVIFGDSHGAKVHHGAAQAFLADVKRLNPHEIVMLGDHVDCGGFLAQHHTLGFVAETNISYEEDIAAANDLLDAVQAAAPNARIHYIEGNHDRRVETFCVTQCLRHTRDAEMLRRAFAPEFLLRLKERRITYYRQSEFYDDLSVPGTIKLGKCFFWHGTSAAKHTTAANIAKVAGNICFGHVHRAQSLAIRPVATGEIGAWCPGCLCELAPLWQHTNPNDWTHGYAVQLVARSEKFLHLNIPIIDGESLLMPLTTRISD
jgi:UDP-2,3-diacylglucosamine pyrophosphatase LpxH